MFGLIKEKVIKLNTIKDFVLVSTKIKKDDKNSIFTIKNRKIMYKPPTGEKLKKVIFYINLFYLLINYPNF